MGNWWFDDQGVNNLRGVDDDPSNPPILPDDTIIDFLVNIPIAREDFKRLLPTMLPEEQERLNAIVARNPRVLEQDPNPDPQVLSDQFMRSFNTSGVFHDPNRRR